MKLILPLSILSVLCNIFSARGDYYGNPTDGCMEDEKMARIKGIPGAICTPSCDDNLCPDAGSGLDPECILQVQTFRGTKKYCALLCEPESDSGCPTTATCQPIQGIGVCTYEAEEGSGEDYVSSSENSFLVSFDASEKKSLRHV
uniref:Uncharacterized protein n=1 Tax=Ditylum brightwellii TaxID=49249 RepID=A0A7S4SNA6_9STRA